MIELPSLFPHQYDLRDILDCFDRIQAVAEMNGILLKSKDGWYYRWDSEACSLYCHDGSVLQGNFIELCLDYVWSSSHLYDLLEVCLIEAEVTVTQLSVILEEEEFIVNG